MATAAVTTDTAVILVGGPGTEMTGGTCMVCTCARVHTIMCLP